MSDIRISTKDLDNPHIDAVLDFERAMNQRSGEYVEDIPTPFYLNPVFYYTVAAMLGAFFAWLGTEPYFDDVEAVEGTGRSVAIAFLLFAIVSSSMGLFLGLTYGIANRNLRQGFICGVIGLGVGVGVGVLLTFVANIAFAISTAIAILMHGAENLPPEDEMIGIPFRGAALMVFICGRGIAWGIVAVASGVGLGIALKSRKLITNGILGAILGGIFGGILFDPIDMLFQSDSVDGWLSRMIGLTVIGAFVGLFIGVFENASKSAWFQMLQGPLSGKQFILFKSPMILGSAPKCDIYLFKDAAIAPKHASVNKTGSKYKIKDLDSESGLFVNGKKIDTYILQSGDVISLGDTVLKYHEKENR